MLQKIIKKIGDTPAPHPPRGKGGHRFVKLFHKNSDDGLPYNALFQHGRNGTPWILWDHVAENSLKLATLQARWRMPEKDLIVLSTYGGHT